MKLEPLNLTPQEQAIRSALVYLRTARKFLRDAGAPKAADRTASAIKSAEGALRHAGRMSRTPDAKRTKRAAV